ncbi:hypothetical protein BH10BAC2_BH10BAC2_38120 [soil metagenome]
MLVFTAAFVSQELQAQNTFPSTGSAGIGTTAPNASSVLEIKSTTQGLLIPRMTKKQRDLIASPAAGLMIYQTNATAGFYYYTGSSWTTVSANAWGTAGNSGTLSTTNFIGTLDSQALRFKVVNQKAGLLDFDPSKANTAFGYQSLNSNTGTKNTANGYLSLFVNTTGSWNVANGAEALYTNSTGYFNTASGYAALNKNTIGDRNIANGSYALNNNTTGRLNAATGVDAMLANTTGFENVANGFEALHNNTTGFSNTASGSGALYSNVEGAFNTALGYQSMYANNGAYNFEFAQGSYNTSLGANAMHSNTVGFNNTAVGYSSLYGSTGSANTGLGYNAGPLTGSFSNTTSVGAEAQATASDQVMLGSTAINSIKAAGNYVIYSDGRFKKNIKQDVPGLEFIKQLQPVTYNYDIHKLNDYINPDNSSQQQSKQSAEIKKINEDAISKKEHKLYTGFIAQDVEKVADKMGFDFSGVYKPQNDKDPYGLSYADFVVPLVKAVQELSKQNDDLKKEYDAKLNAQQKQIDDLKAMISPKQSSGISATSLEQNIPNPYNHTTQINYALPQTYSTAKIIITDNSGRAVKEVNISGSGKGSVKIDASALANGVYNYSLYINEKFAGTKQMIIAK